MPDGKALQSGTSHYLGQGFAEAYGISYLGRQNKLETPHQTSWGVSTRLLGAIIMVHGDDNGLVLPPRVAPTQVVIVPIKMQAEGVLDACHEIYDSLKKQGIRVKLDDDDSRTPGWKFAQYEMKGVPLRIEVGPRDLANGQAVLTKRVNGEKKILPIKEIESLCAPLLDEIHNDMYQKALKYRDAHITKVNNIEELNAALDNVGGYAMLAYDGTPESELKIKELTKGGTARCIAEELPEDTSLVDPVTGKKARIIAYFARAY